VSEPEPKGVLARWSERKQAARRGETGDEPTAPAPSAEAPPPAPAPTEAPVLPPIESLDFHSDYTVFLAKNVPEALRRAALRKLWVSDPVLANLDGLNDYDEDFNLVDRAITLAESSYRPGLGYLDAAENQEAAPAEKLAQRDADSPGQAAASDRSDGEAGMRESDAAVGKPAETAMEPEAGEPVPSAAEPTQAAGK
jgi:Protein of unknown function (DUF3306)